MKGFYHIWVWRPSWSCDPDAANKFSFPFPKEAPHQIWLQSGKRFQRRCFNIVDNDGRTKTDDRWTTDHGYPISSPISLWLRRAKNQESNIKISSSVLRKLLTSVTIYLCCITLDKTSKADCKISLPWISTLGNKLPLCIFLLK